MAAPEPRDEGYERLLAAPPPAWLVGLAGLAIAGGSAALLAAGSRVTWLLAVPGLPVGTALVWLAVSKTRGRNRGARTRAIAADAQVATLSQRVKARLAARGAPATVHELASELDLEQDDLVLARSLLQEQGILDEEVSTADGSFRYRLDPEATHPEARSHLSLRSRATSAIEAP